MQAPRLPLGFFRQTLSALASFWALVRWVPATGLGVGVGVVAVVVVVGGGGVVVVVVVVPAAVTVMVPVIS